MAEDIVRTGIQIDIDTASAVSQLNALEQQISQFNTRIVSSNDAMRAALSANTKLLQQQIGDLGQFSTQIKTIQTNVGNFSTALEKGKLSFGEYFKYGLASTKTFGKAFTKELDTINATAEDRVKRLSTRYVALGKQMDGMQKVLAIRPEVLPEGMDTQLALAAQKQQIFNQLLRQGSTHLVNWGKNTQWAGRQLMVGFTIPLTIFGGIASKVFMDLERQAVNFRRVYGDAFTPAGETDAMLEEVKALSIEFTKYGITASETMDMAAQAAATGAQGADLIAATTEATRLATLGQIDQQQALDATIALQSAFTLSATELAQAVDFLNAVENQTVVSLSDVTQAIPRAATVIQGLGGDVQTLSAFLAAMRENGVNAAEGANALKSGLASLINPTKQAREQLEAVGIDIQNIVETNRGDLMGTVQAFAQAVNALDPLTRQQTLAQVFGKYQFARLGALFENIVKDGSQASRVLELMGDDVANLAALSEKELGAIEDAIGVKFQGAVERLKIAIAPLGEIFLKIATPIVEAATKAVDAFNAMPTGIKTAVAAVVALLAGIAPVFLMGIGLIGNGLGNMIKGFDVLRGAYQRMTGKVTGATGPMTQAFGFMTNAELDAAAAANSLEGNLSDLTGTALLNREAIDGLTGAYTRFAGAMNQAATARPQGVMTMPRPRRMATGGMVGGRGNKDSEPALLMPGEFVVTKEATEKYAPILVAMNQGKLAGYAEGTQGRFVPPVSSSADIPQSSRALYEFGHSAGFASSELKSTVTSLSETADSIRMLGDNASDADRALLELLDTVLNAEKTFVKFEQAADGSWQATEVTSKALRELSGVAEGAASLGQFGGGRITSGTRNQALALIGVDEPISFADLRMAAQQAEQKLTAVANGAAEMQLPFQYALQGVIDEYRILEGDLQAQSTYLLDNAQAMVRDALMTDQKIDAEQALARSLEKRQQIEQDLVRAGAMLEGEIVDSARAQQVVEAHLLDYAQALAISTDPQVAKRASMSATGSADAGKIVQPRVTGGRGKIFTTPASRTSVAQSLQEEGYDVGREIGVYLGPAISEGVLDGVDVGSPPPWSIQLGEWIAEGIQIGAKEQSARLQTAYPSMPYPRFQPDPNIAANMQSIRYNVAEPRVLQGAFEPDPQIAKNLEELGFSAGKAAVANEKDAVASIIDAEAHVDNASATHAETAEKKKGMGGFRSMLYALDGLSLAMSFLPGPIGEIANKAFIVSAAFSALDAMLRVQIISGALKKFGAALVAASGVQLASTAAKGASAGAGIAGDIATTAALLGGGKGKGIGRLLTRFGGAIAKVTKPVITAGRVFVGLASRLGAFILKIVTFGRLIVGVGSKFAALTGIGAIITAVVAVFETIAGFKKYIDIGNELKDLGNAARVAADSLESMAEKFGFTARTTGFANQGTVLGRTEEARTVAQEARTFVSEDAGLQQSVEAARTATDAQAEAIIRSLFMSIKAGGASEEVATAIVEAVANEAGRTTIFLDVQPELNLELDKQGNIKNISEFISNNLTPSVDVLQQSLNELSSQGFNEAFNQDAVDDARRWFAITDSLPEAMKEMIVPAYKQKQAIFETAKSFELLKTNSKTAMDLLSAEFVNGKISLENFNTGMDQVYQTLASLPNNQGLQIMKEQLIALYPQSEATINSIDDAKIAFDLLNLAAQGVNMSGFIQQMQNAAMSAAEVRAELNALMSAQAAVSAAESDIARIEAELAVEKAKPGPKKGQDTGGSGGSSDPFAGRENKLRDQQAEITIKEIKIDRTAEDRLEKKLENRFGDTSVTIGEINVDMETFADVDNAIDLIGEKIEDIQRGPIKAVEDEIKVINDEIGVYQDQLDVINRDIDLQEQAIRRIEEEYKPILDSLEDQKKAQEDILQGLEDQRDAATRPYEDQIALLERQLRVAEQAAKPRLDALQDEEDALDAQSKSLDDQISYIDEQKDALSEVAKLNDYIARQQKNRLNLTQALAEGDIYAATAAANQMKQDAADQAAEQQQNAFDEQKKSLEDQKDLIQDRKDAIDDERQLIQESLQAIQDQIDAQEYQKFLIEDSYRLSIQAAQDALSATDKEIAKQTDLRDARIQPYKDIIDNYAPQIDAINNAIYAKEQAIKTLEEQRLTPLEDQITKLEEQRDLLEDIRGDVEAEIARDKASLQRRKEYLDQELQILAARRELANLSSGGGGGGAGGTEGTRDKEKIKKLEEELAAAIAARDAAQQEAGDIAGPPAIEEETSWWDGIVNAAKNAWSGFSGWFDENVIQPVISAWNTVSGWVDENVIQPIKNAWNTISTEVSAVVETIAALLVAIWQIFDEQVITPIKTAWNAWYDDNVAPKLQALKDWWEKIRAEFALKFNAIKTFFITWWNTSIQPKLDTIKEVWENVRSNFVEKFNAIKDFFVDWWNTNIQPKIDIFVGMWEQIRAAFVEKFEAIGDWWDEWKRLTFDQKVDAMKASLSKIFNWKTWYNWMIDAVGGIMKAWNKLRLELSVPDNFVTSALGIAGKSITLDTPDLPIPEKIYAGGSVAGEGSRDSVAAMLTPGEFVVRKAMVDKYGTPMFDAINQGSFSMPKYNVQRSTAGNIDVKTESTANIVAPMYNNYSVNVSVSNTNASADEIANKTIMKIKQMQNMQIRSGRGY